MGDCMKNELAINEGSQDMTTPASRTPRVSIGVPVYNGENYLTEALDALLGQSFGDFELIISDNGSTDATGSICRQYSAKDPRIRYYHSAENRGAAWNFNRVVELANGDYFMWAAHDDLWEPDFIKKCVAALDQSPDAVLCYTCTREIVGRDRQVNREFSVNPRLNALRAHERFAAGWGYPPQIPVFGLIRTEILRRTRLIGNFSASDQVLVGELAMLGPFHGIPECLFFYRRHEKQSTASPYPTMRSRMAWFDPKNPIRLTFPHWRLLREHLVGIWRSPAHTTEKVLSSMSVLRWVVRKRRDLLGELILRDVHRYGTQKHQLG